VTPRWVTRAGTAEEVSRLLALASSERLAVAPRGSGSSASLGGPPRRLDLVLDVSRLAAMIEYVPEDMVASVEAGATLGAIEARLAARGQRLTLDPPGGESRTIGGELATGRDLLLGVRFVQADGTITWGGSKVVKSVTGYDVPKLLVGSLGTLGVMVGATLRLHPLPAATGSWLCAFDSIEGARGFLAALLSSSIEPDRLVLANAPARGEIGCAGPGPAVLVSVGSVEAAVTAQGSVIAGLARREGGTVETLDPSRWKALGRALAGPVLLKLVGETREITRWMTRAEDLAVRSGMGVSAVGWAGNGVLNISLGGAATGGALAAGLLAPLRDELGAEGGSIVVERVPAGFKADVDVWGPISPERLEIMARLKREFDPLGVLNPGRFVGGL
jgi:glycolate oxidase FAD binding subunit